MSVVLLVNLTPEGEKKSRRRRLIGPTTGGLTASGRDSQASYLMGFYGRVNGLVSVAHIRAATRRIGSQLMRIDVTLVIRGGPAGGPTPVFPVT